MVKMKIKDITIMDFQVEIINIAEKILSDVAHQNEEGSFFLNLFNLPEKITEKMIYQFYKEIPASSVIWGKGRWTTADVKFSGYKNFERAVRLGPPVFEDGNGCARTSFLNLPKETRMRESARLKEEAMQRRRDWEQKMYNQKYPEKESKHSYHDPQPQQTDHKNYGYYEGKGQHKEYENQPEEDYSKDYKKQYEKGHKYVGKSEKTGYEKEYEDEYKYYKQGYEEKGYSYQQNKTDKHKHEKTDYQYTNQDYGKDKYWEKDYYQDQYEKTAEAHKDPSSKYYSYHTEETSYAKYTEQAGKRHHHDDYDYKADQEEESYYKQTSKKDQTSHKRHHQKDEYEDKRTYAKESQGYSYEYPEYGDYRGYQKPYNKSDYNYTDYQYSYPASRNGEKKPYNEKKGQREEKYHQQGRYKVDPDGKKYSEAYGGSMQNKEKEDPKFSKENKETYQPKNSKKLNPEQEFHDYQKYDYGQSLGRYDYKNPPSSSRMDENKPQPQTAPKKKGFDSTGGSSFILREVTGYEVVDKPKAQPLGNPTGPIMAESGFQKGVVTPASDNPARFPASGSFEHFTKQIKSSPLEPSPHGQAGKGDHLGYAGKASQRIDLLEQIKPEMPPKHSKLVSSETKPPAEKYSYYGATANDIAKQFTQNKTEKLEATPKVVSNNTPKIQGGDLRKISEEGNDDDWGPRKFYNTARKQSSNLNKDSSP